MSVTGFQRRRRELTRHGRQAVERHTARQEAETQPEQTVRELREAAKAQGVAGYGRMRKAELLSVLRG